MPVLSKQFKDALSMIEPGADADNAAKAHAAVRDFLSGDIELVEWGLHTILIGSYKREVSIRRVKDVDVFCELPDLPDDMHPAELLDRFVEVLRGEYGDRTFKNDRSVKVEFPDYDMHVDLVPARRSGDAWEIPDKNCGWEQTNPIKFGEITTARNSDHDGKYVPVVKLLRQTRRALLGDAKPGGLFIEVAAYHAFGDIPDVSSAGAPGSTAAYYTVALEHMVPILRGHADGTEPLMNPALANQELHVRATQDELDGVADAWEEAARDARAALEADEEQSAAETFRRLLGKNSDGVDVFTVPTASSAAAAIYVGPGQRKLPSGDSPNFA